MTKSNSIGLGQNILLRPLFNRELSWLAFNDRVLEEAQDTSLPLLERLKFVAIVSSNLDEFFSIRVAGLERKMKSHHAAKEDDGLRTSDALYQVREWALAQKARQATVLNELLAALKDHGLFLQTQIDINDSDLTQFSIKHAPEIKIQDFKKLENLSSIAGGRIHVFARLRDRFAILSWADTVDRLVPVPIASGKAKYHYLLAEKMIVAAANHYFVNDTVLEAFPFKVIRDAEVNIDPNTDPEDLLTNIEEAILTRAKQSVVRLEIDAPHVTDGALLLANALKLKPRSIYRYDAPLDLKILWRLQGFDGFENLKIPAKQKSQNHLSRVPDIVKILRGQDILLHHPYDSFETVEHLLKAAAADKDVTVIRQTLYRTNPNSPIVDALKDAAKAGKQVTVAVELRARFDETHNIQLSKDLKKFGVRVLRGFPDKKIHCKLTQILRREDGALRSFVHIGTGNYNPNTAKLYTDFGLLTADKSFGRDAEKIFKAIESGRNPRTFEAFVTAPTQLHRKLLAWIRVETKNAQAGDKNARIIAKVNAIVDKRLVEALYEASNAGVKVDLIVRGACVLRPGVPGLSENIRVISIVDKYLEHSRIYYFQNDRFPLVYLSSADWMPRNFHNRLEVAFPLHDSELKKFVKDTVLETYLKDNQKARQLMPDGNWIRVKPVEGESAFRAQDVFDQLARSNYKGTALFSRFVLQKEENLNLS
jgi:polyphosphate kinase